MRYFESTYKRRSYISLSLSCYYYFFFAIFFVLGVRIYQYGHKNICQLQTIQELNDVTRTFYTLSMSYHLLSII